MRDTRRRSFLKTVTGGAAGASLLAGCIGGGPVKKTNNVELTENGFKPKNVHIASQDTLTWINKDDTVHTVTSASSDFSFNTKLDPGQGVGHTFNFDGVYKIVCSEHGSPDDFSGERMKLSVGSAEIKEPVE